MIRLALPGADDNTRLEMSRRLHRMTFTTSLEDATAVAVLGAATPEWLAALCSQCGSRPLLVTPGALTTVEAWTTYRAMDPGLHRCLASPARSAPSVRLMRQQLDSGRMGLPGLLRLHRWQSVQDAGPVWPADWLCDLDLAIWMMGGPPDRVFATGPVTSAMTEAGGRQAETPRETLQLHCSWPGGAMALLDFSRRLPQGERYYSLMLIGSSGAMSLDDHQNRQLVFRSGVAETSLDEETIPAMAGMLQQFVDGVAAGDCSCLGSGSGHWADVLHLSKLAEQSATCGRALKWQEE